MTKVPRSGTVNPPLPAGHTIYRKNSRTADSSTTFSMGPPGLHATARASGRAAGNFQSSASGRRGSGSDGPTRFRLPADSTTLWRALVQKISPTHNIPRENETRREFCGFRPDRRKKMKSSWKFGSGSTVQRRIFWVRRFPIGAEGSLCQLGVQPVVSGGEDGSIMAGPERTPTPRLDGGEPRDHD